MAAADAEAAGLPIVSAPALPERFGVTALYELLELAERFGQRPDLFVAWLERDPAWTAQLRAYHQARRQVDSGEEAYIEALRRGGAKARGA